MFVPYNCQVLSLAHRQFQNQWGWTQRGVAGKGPAPISRIIGGCSGRTSTPYTVTGVTYRWSRPHRVQLLLYEVPEHKLTNMVQ